MTSRIIEGLGARRSLALRSAEKIKYYREIMFAESEEDLNLIREVAFELELAAIDLIMDRSDDPEMSDKLKEIAADAFRLLQVLPQLDDPFKNAYFLVRLSSLAIIGDNGTDAGRLLRQRGWLELFSDSNSWAERTWATILDIWLRLFRKKGWDDRDMVLSRVEQLRDTQDEFERDYFIDLSPNEAKGAALELIGLYHLAKAAEVFAIFITDGVVAGNFQVRQILETHFDRVFEVCKLTPMVLLEPMVYLLSAASAQMVDNSIWTVTRSVNSRVTQFVRTLVDRGRGDKAIFDVLPPQRRALAEKGLLGSSRRAVVVSLPTSSGKTLIAEFRILQALNQFDDQEGWVAYLAPTKALVNQVTRQLRKDFNPLKVIVEHISPALELDATESNLLLQGDRALKFRVLVATPEKFDLMLRQGWEAKIGRPLTLVVVDEAHNIQNINRGLRLELLLGTINKECENAQFLLLTPFINNAREVARWLGGRNSDDISLSLDWQPNDRIIGIIQPKPEGLISKGSFNYSLSFKSVHTTQKTISIEDFTTLPEIIEGGNETFSKINNATSISVLAAQYLQTRGPVIIMHSRPDWVWSLAKKLLAKTRRILTEDADVILVKRYIGIELGEDFPLIELLDHGIGVHHAGLPDDVRSLIEWLFENDKLNYLVATTTIAQGVNFPVSAVVMASHQYFSSQQGAIDMPAEDFWNIAGRAGRISHGQLGVIALAANSDTKVKELEEFINKQTGDLNSALIRLVEETRNELDDLGSIVYRHPEWSSFLQYLAHTYRQMGEPKSYFEEIEQVLRGTFGFEKLRIKDAKLAQRLLGGIETYTKYLQQPNQPLKLVDSTGFSLQSIKTVLAHKGNINEKSWDFKTIFTDSDRTLQEMMGILLRVPELRENLSIVTGGLKPDGKKLASIIKDWVNGETVFTIACKYFQEPGQDPLTAITRCGQNLFGRLSQTASWGLGALLSITASNLPPDDFTKLKNLPSKVFYGVKTDGEITLRLLGIPRTAASNMAKYLGDSLNEPLPILRARLTNLELKDWMNALGSSGIIYQKIWKLSEGV